MTDCDMWELWNSVRLVYRTLVTVHLKVAPTNMNACACYAHWAILKMNRDIGEQEEHDGDRENNGAPGESSDHCILTPPPPMKTASLAAAASSQESSGHSLTMSQTSSLDGPVTLSNKLAAVMDIMNVFGSGNNWANYSQCIDHMNNVHRADAIACLSCNG